MTLAKAVVDSPITVEGSRLIQVRLKCVAYHTVQKLVTMIKCVES